MARIDNGNSTDVYHSGAPGPLAMPWRQAAQAADGAYIPGMSDKPVQVKGVRATLVCPNACCSLVIDGSRVYYSGRGKRLSLQTQDLLGAKVRTPTTACYDGPETLLLQTWTAWNFYVAVVGQNSAMSMDT